MNTNIFLTKKLEKTVTKFIIKNLESSIEKSLNNWNANIFYVSQKKCWIITNSATYYTILLDRIKSADYKNITEIFTKTFYDQLLTDNIEIDFSKLQNIVGEINLAPTNNDRKVLGVQNSILENIKDWKYKYGHIDNWNFRNCNRIINGIPYKINEYFLPKEKMKKLLLKE